MALPMALARALALASVSNVEMKIVSFHVLVVLCPSIPRTGSSSNSRHATCFFGNTLKFKMYRSTDTPNATFKMRSEGLAIDSVSSS
jgi:hypothetical protein